MNTTLAELIQQAGGKEETKLKFLNRLDEGRLTRQENPTSHLCVYFAVFDPKTHRVFIGHHKKSGLWLFNGGHMDPNESAVDTVVREAKEEWGILPPNAIPLPKLVTLTEIDHPERMICEWHYDLWFFLPMDERAFHPDPQHLAAEFNETGWKTYEEARNLFSEENSKEALAYIQNAG